MSDTKVYQFGTEGNSALATVLPLLQQRGIDPAYLMGMMGNNNGGFFGNNALEGIIALIVVAAIFGNGNFGFGGFGGNNGAGYVASTAERDLLAHMIQRNGTDLSQLAQSINCSTGRIDDAIQGVATQLCNLASQNGMSFQQVINAVQSNNSALATQLCNCCCDIRAAIADSKYATERGFCNTNQILSKGFSDLGYASQAQTCELKGAIKDSTDRIIDGQRQAELRALTDKIDALREKNSTLTTQLNLEHQNQYTAGVVGQAIAPVNAALADLSKRLADIECNQPPVAKIPYVPAAGNYIPVNYSVPMHFGVSNYGCGYNNGCGYGC